MSLTYTGTNGLFTHLGKLVKQWGVTRVKLSEQHWVNSGERHRRVADLACGHREVLIYHHVNQRAIVRFIPGSY